ncbi:hypothetical protein HK101_011069 [Irineochytrium annulatum]|nr:hypothetical protein HK101_011069 [Irineochytrium annulatum]
MRCGSPVRRSRDQTRARWPTKSCVDGSGGHAGRRGREDEERRVREEDNGPAPPKPWRPAEEETDEGLRVDAGSWSDESGEDSGDREGGISVRMLGAVADLDERRLVGAPVVAAESMVDKIESDQRMRTSREVWEDNGGETRKW